DGDALDVAIGDHDAAHAMPAPAHQVDRAVEQHDVAEEDPRRAHALDQIRLLGRARVDPGEEVVRRGAPALLGAAVRVADARPDEEEAAPSELVPYPEVVLERAAAALAVADLEDVRAENAALPELGEDRLARLGLARRLRARHAALARRAEHVVV